MDYAKEALRLHAKWNGKLETVPKMKIENSYSSGIKIFKSGIFAICSHKIILLNVFTKHKYLQTKTPSHLYIAMEFSLL